MTTQTNGPAKYWAIRTGTPPRPGTYRVFGEDNTVLGFAHWDGTSWGAATYSLDLVKRPTAASSRKKAVSPQIIAWAYCQPGKKSEIALALSIVRGVVTKAMSSPLSGALQMLILTPTHVDSKRVSASSAPQPCYIALPAFVAFQHADLATGTYVEVISQKLDRPLRQWRSSTQAGSPWFEAVHLKVLPQLPAGSPAAPEFLVEDDCLVVIAQGKRKKMTRKATNQLKAMLAIE